MSRAEDRFESPALPARYEAVARLGQGGAGEVWAVCDRYTGRSYALKLLSRDAGEGASASLVKEAVALSGLEGLGVPRVISFGKLADNSRLYMLRELVEGRSLQELIEAQKDARACLSGLALAAEKLTRVHRAGLLHGDIKPANIIVSIEQNDASLVDLGLAEPFRDRGTTARGLTPKYAAPELLAGGALTVRAEIHALGVTLADIIEPAWAREALGPRESEALSQVQKRATARDPQSRYPSADEFAAALRGSAKLRDSTVSLDGASLWPIAGIEPVSARLLRLAMDAEPGALLAVTGPSGAGKSVLLTRLAWSLGVEGQPLVWIDDGLLDNPAAVQSEIESLPDDPDATLIIDDYEHLDADNRARALAVRARGARVIAACAAPIGEADLHFEVPQLVESVAAELVRRAVPSLTPRVVKRLLEVSGRRPGRLRRLIQRIAAASVVSEQDVEALLGGQGRGSTPPESPLGQIQDLLDRGRFTEAQAVLESGVDADPVGLATARARLLIGIGDAEKAREALLDVQTLAESRKDSDRGRAWRLWLARAEVGRRKPEVALSLLDELAHLPGPLGAEAMVYRGLALFHAGKIELATQCLTEARENARLIGASRVEGLALLCLGRVHLHTEENDAARTAFEQALVAAEHASDASALATAQSNLAVLLRKRGDIAGAIQHFEAAIDAGRRSGRLSSVRLSLANLANTDLYLGRLERAQTSIEELERIKGEIGEYGRAQLTGLKADLLSGSGQLTLAAATYRECADAFSALNMGEPAAEARLSAVLLTSQEENPNLEALWREVRLSREQIGESPTHRPLHHLAQARLHRVAKQDAEARAQLEQALAEARATEQPEWVWRALDVRAELEAADGQVLMAQRDREAAVLVLEEIAARLPQDLREVYWNDERRKRLRAALPRDRKGPRDAALAMTVRSTNGGYAIAPLSETTRTPLERRLARILEINSELLADFDLERLTVRVIECALELLNAERGFVLLRQEDGSLSVHTSRDLRGDVVRAEFSRSIAQRVMASHKPVVSLDASRDVSLQSYASVHALMLQAVACVPIAGRRGDLIGALYLETRLTPGGEFERELPTLGAFADQVGLAIETARLVTENMNRARELADTNAQLETAQERLRELLGDRTQKLKVARKKLRDARDTLYGHFGYQGMVGTGAAMRRLYSMIERVKDTDVPVLISGESGTGKEVASRAVHRASERNKEPFLGINCGAIPEHLLESELFGHVRGAFTGADRERKGLLREAGSGTVLLDEIGEMPQKMQASMLRVLQERKVRPVGGTAEIDIECRFIFATHRNLRQMVDDGRFREDLYYRIVVVELTIPSLRDHTEDIAPLVDYFLGLFAARYKREKKTLTRAALRRLQSYDWPGNVRQLEHVLLNAWVLSDQAEIDVEDLDLPDSHLIERSRPPAAPDSEEVTGPPAVANDARAPARQSLSSHLNDEKTRIAEALAACNWNRVRAAEMLGMPRRTFYRRLKQYQLQ